MRKRVFGHMQTAKSQISLHCQLKESLDSTEYINGEQTRGWYFSNAQGDLNWRGMHMFEGSFSLDAAQIIIIAKPE